MIKAVHKAICPACKGNGFIRVPYELTRDEQWADCEVCKSQGELTYDEKNFVEQFAPNKSNQLFGVCTSSKWKLFGCQS